MPTQLKINEFLWIYCDVRLNSRVGTFSWCQSLQYRIEAWKRWGQKRQEKRRKKSELVLLGPMRALISTSKFRLPWHADIVIFVLLCCFRFAPCLKSPFIVTSRNVRRDNRIRLARHMKALLITQRNFVEKLHLFLNPLHFLASRW